jgi:hypothetical protein
MHEYLTRAMVARKPITYCGQELRPGDPFAATPVDGDYLIKCGRAEDAAAEEAPAAPVPAPVSAAAPAPVVATVEVPQESEPVESAQAEPEAGASVDAPEAAPEPEQPATRRRGRPTNAERAARAAEASE